MPVEKFVLDTRIAIFIPFSGMIVEEGMIFRDLDHGSPEMLEFLRRQKIPEYRHGEPDITAWEFGYSVGHLVGRVVISGIRALSGSSPIQLRTHSDNPRSYMYLLR